jgi:hypothetical protein
MRSWGSSVSTVSDYRLDDQVPSPEKAKDSSSSVCIQTSSKARLVSYPTGIGSPFAGGKVQPGRDTDHSPHLLPRSRLRSDTSSSAYRLHGGSETGLLYLCPCMNLLKKSCQTINRTKKAGCVDLGYLCCCLSIWMAWGNSKFLPSANTCHRIRYRACTDWWRLGKPSLSHSLWQRQRLWASIRSRCIAATHVSNGMTISDWTSHILSSTSVPLKDRRVTSHVGAIKGNANVFQKHSRTIFPYARRSRRLVETDFKQPTCSTFCECFTVYFDYCGSEKHLNLSK